MRSLALFLLMAVACSGAVAIGSGDAGQRSEAEQGASRGAEAGACTYPADVVVSSPSGAGCFGGPAGQICLVSSGAAIDSEDGAVTNGTESCASLCKAGEFEMTCSDTSMSPAPSLGCTIIAIPTPLCCRYYCCPCAQ
jgi:hypothetical protein